jgi:hypothetical protein
MMRTETLNSYAIALDSGRRMLADLRDDQWFAQPIEGMNHPAWIVGHLAYSCQMIGIEMGLAAWLPEDWGEYFGTDARSAAVGERYSSPSELLSAFENAAKRVQRRLAEIDDTDLAGPLPDQRHRETFPTLGHAVLHILTVHTAVHLGQLSTWRHAIGLPSV